ncbi:MAG: cobyrinic acid a,c-diamide synthase, partial [Chroococcales cyanobacterium]
MTLIIAGDRSGVGKTTVTLALLSFLSRSGYNVQSFKVGPDYIDPMFHTAVTGRPCRNLDPVLTSEAYVRECFSRHSKGIEYALIEGVMGLFDGIMNPPNTQEMMRDFASTAHIARLLDLPVLLVLDCSRLSGSIAAIAHGFRSFDSRVKIAGVILNRVGSD